MQFASPKGLLNFFMGGDSSIFASNEGKLKKYSTPCGFCMFIITNNLKSQLILADQPSWHFDLCCAKNKSMSCYVRFGIRYLQFHLA